MHRSPHSKKSVSRILKTPHELERAVLEAGKVLVGKVGVDDDFLGRGDFVVSGELGGGGTDSVHETSAHEDLGLDAGGQELDVDVTEPGENLHLTGMGWIEVSKISF